MIIFHFFLFIIIFFLKKQGKRWDVVQHKRKGQEKKERKEKEERNKTPSMNLSFF